MELSKKIISVLKNLTKKQSRPILEKICIRDGRTYATDLETYVELKNDFSLPVGLYRPEFLEFAKNEGDAFDVSEYPVPMKFKKEKSIVAKISDLDELLPFCSKDQTRIQLNSILVEQSGLVATNGHIMGVIPNDYSTALGDSEFLLSRQSVGHMLKVLAALGHKKSESIRIEFNDSWACIDTPTATIYSRLIDREYPKWRLVLPNFSGKNVNTFHIDGGLKASELRPMASRTEGVEIDFNRGRVVGYDDLSEISRPINIHNSGDRPSENWRVNYRYLCEVVGKGAKFTQIDGARLVPVKFERLDSGLHGVIVGVRK